MFGRQRKDNENVDLLAENKPPSSEITSREEIEEMMLSVSLEQQDSDDTEVHPPVISDVSASPEIVTVVEKISGILSPYFIVLVGLFLYKSNVFFGTILISVGILSLLNISWQDVVKLWEKIQKTLNSNETDFIP